MTKLQCSKALDRMVVPGGLHDRPINQVGLTWKRDLEQQGVRETAGKQRAAGAVGTDKLPGSAEVVFQA